MQEEILMGVRIVRKALIQTSGKTHSPPIVRGVAVSLKPEGRIFKIILNDDTVEFFLKMLPHLLKFCVCFVFQRLYSGAVH